MNTTYRIINSAGARLTNSKDGWYFQTGVTGAKWRKRRSAESHFKVALQASGKGGPVSLRIEPDDGSPATIEEITP